MTRTEARREQMRRGWWGECEIREQKTTGGTVVWDVPGHLRQRAAACGAGHRTTSHLLFHASLLFACLASVHGGQFHPNKSTSFMNEEQLFKVEYLDDASLTGFVAEDIVQLGDYYVSTRFGCVTKSKGHDWAQADGILGMGFPAAALRSVPFPLFWALTDPNKMSLDNSNILMNRIFTLMLSQDRGELVLGGHDPASVEVCPS